MISPKPQRQIKDIDTDQVRVLIPTRPVKQRTKTIQVIGSTSSN